MNRAIRESVLKNSISIWLDIDVKTINKRVGWNKKRPLLKKGNNLETKESKILQTIQSVS